MLFGGRAAGGGKKKKKKKKKTPDDCKNRDAYRPIRVSKKKRGEELLSFYNSKTRTYDDRYVAGIRKGKKEGHASQLEGNLTKGVEGKKERNQSAQGSPLGFFAAPVHR